MRSTGGRPLRSAVCGVRRMVTTVSGDGRSIGAALELGPRTDQRRGTILQQARCCTINRGPRDCRWFLERRRFSIPPHRLTIGEALHMLAREHTVRYDYTITSSASSLFTFLVVTSTP